MMVLVVDVTKHLKVLFQFVYGIYNFLNSLEFTAFGFRFTLLGLLLGFIFLVVVIKFMKFGFETGVSAEIKYMRAENKKDKKAEGRNVLRKGR